MKRILSCILLLSATYVASAQPLWEHTDITVDVVSALTSPTTYTAIERMPNGDWLFIGRVDDCFYPFVSRFSSTGELIRQRPLQIGQTNYGYVSEAIVLPNGKIGLVSWGAVADDVGGSNGFICVLDTLLQIEHIDSVEVYTTSTPQGAIRMADGWVHGDTFTAVYIEEVKRKLHVRQYQIDSLQLIRRKDFAWPSSPQWFSQMQGIGVHADTFLISMDNKLYRWAWGQGTPIDTFTAQEDIHALQVQGETIIILDKCSGYRVNKDLTVLQTYPWPFCVEEAFFLANSNGLLFGLSESGITQLYRWDHLSLPQLMYTDETTFRLSQAGYQASDSVWYLGGQNWIKAAGWAINPDSQRVIASNDMALTEVRVEGRIIDSMPVFNGWQYKYGYTFYLTVENHSAETIDSFGIWNSSGLNWGMNCSSPKLGDTFHYSISPGGSAIVQFDFSISVTPLPNTICFRVIAPNGKIDEDKTNNAACGPVTITGIADPTTGGNRLWCVPDSKSIFLQAERPTGSFTLRNIQGKVVLQRPIRHTNMQLSYELPAGMYIGTIYHESGWPVLTKMLFLP